MAAEDDLIRLVRDNGWGLVVDPDARPLEVLAGPSDLTVDLASLKADGLKVRFIFEHRIAWVKFQNVNSVSIELIFTQSVSNISVGEARAPVTLESRATPSGDAIGMLETGQPRARRTGEFGPETVLEFRDCEKVSLRSMSARLEIAGTLGHLDIAESVLVINDAPSVTLGLLTVRGKACIINPLVVRELKGEAEASLRFSHISCQMFGTGGSADGVLSILGHSAAMPEVFAGDKRGLLEIEQFQPGTRVNLPESDSELRIVGPGAIGLRVSGVGLVSLHSGATVSDLVASPENVAGGTPRLAVGPYATVSNLEGEFRFDYCKDSRVAGTGPGGFTFAGVTGDDPVDALFGAVIENVSVRSSDHRARTLWAQLGNAAIVVPSLRAAKLDDYSEILKKRTRTSENMRQLGVIAAAAREMAGVADSNGAPGSIRSQANWSAYYMRQLTAPSRWERMILWCYRLIGYGERPSPAFILWFLGTIVMSAAFSDHRGLLLSWDGVLVMLNEWSEWMIPTLGLLNLGQVPGGTEERTALRFLAHSVLAIPFLTGVLALRNFVKADRPNR